MTPHILQVVLLVLLIGYVLYRIRKDSLPP